MKHYEKMIQKRLTGWNTWNVNSMLSHVLMPHGFLINIGVKEYREGDFLAEALLGRPEKGANVQRMESGIEEVFPGAHALDGSYTQILIKWRGISFSVETASDQEDLFVIVTPHETQKKTPLLVASAGILWNFGGMISSSESSLEMKNDTASVAVHMIGKRANERNIPLSTPYLACTMDQPVYVYTGKPQTAIEIEQKIAKKRQAYEAEIASKGSLGKYYQALAETLAWNVIYDPTYHTIKTIVGRIWSREWGGYVQHCWDMFFNGLMYGVVDDELAANSVMEILRETTAEGFVPTCAAATGFVTLDRSQPPVGSMIVEQICQNGRIDWLKNETFDQLYAWNTWFFEHRQVLPGILGWGSKPFEPQLDNYWESAGVGKFYGAAMESGLDNSPMYDNIEIDPVTNIMKLGDVGLTSLYLADTQSLIRLANDLNRNEQLRCLTDRREICAKGLERLWSEERGIYLNLHTDSNTFDQQLSPTHFYPLFTGLVIPSRAERMVKEHLLNPNEFWGEWVLPSISKDNPTFIEQDYWRGRIWPPMNLLVYLGLQKSGFADVANELARKSGALLMKEWEVNRHVHENYCAFTGEGCNKENSEEYYSWGALLAYMYIDSVQK